MSDELTGGVIEITEKDLSIVIHAFELTCDHPEFDKAVERALDEGLDIIEATIQARRVVMCMCLSKQLGISQELLEKFIEHPTWQSLVDSLIRDHDEEKVLRGDKK